MAKKQKKPQREPQHLTSKVDLAEWLKTQPEWYRRKVWKEYNKKRKSK